MAKNNRQQKHRIRSLGSVSLLQQAVWHLIHKPCYKTSDDTSPKASKNSFQRSGFIEGLGKHRQRIQKQTSKPANPHSMDGGVLRELKRAWRLLLASRQGDRILKEQQNTMASTFLNFQRYQYLRDSQQAYKPPVNTRVLFAVIHRVTRNCWAKPAATTVTTN